MHSVNFNSKGVAAQHAFFNFYSMTKISLSFLLQQRLPTTAISRGPVIAVVVYGFLFLLLLITVIR